MASLPQCAPLSIGIERFTSVSKAIRTRVDRQTLRRHGSLFVDSKGGLTQSQLAELAAGDVLTDKLFAMSVIAWQESSRQQQYM